jgi:hypothetical protein
VARRFPYSDRTQNENRCLPAAGVALEFFDQSHWETVGDAHPGADQPSVRTRVGVVARKLEISFADDPEQLVRIMITSVPSNTN